MKASKAYLIAAFFGLAFWILVIDLAMGATVPSTGFFTRANCSTISNPSANSVVCLQTTTTGGRTAGKMYVWNGSAYAEFSGSGVPAGPITTSGLTQATGKLLGRGTASTGAIEEITIGTNLSLSGTTLNASAGAGGYATIQEEGSDLTQRTKLNFIGSSITCVDDSGNTRTNCTITGGGSSALTLIETQTLTSDSTSVTFSGLDGNTDGVYLLIGRLQQKVGTGKTYLHPNGVTTDQDGQVWDPNGPAGDSHIFIGFLASGDWWNFSVVIHAKFNPNSQSFPRIVTGTGMRTDSGFTFARNTQIGGVWADTSTNITSLVILNDQTSGLGNGSTFSLYKYAQ